MRIWRLVLGASIFGVGAVAVACSSSSSPPSMSSEDAGSDAPAAETGSTCVTPDASVATVDGGAVWGCLQMMCSMQMAACACDPTCNTAIGEALIMTEEDAGSATALLTKAVESNATDMAVLNLGNCLAANSSMCGGPVVEAGVDGASSSEGGPSEAGSTTEGGSEGGGSSSEGGSDGGNG